MTAPKPLPPCPVCRMTPSEWEARDEKRWVVACVKYAPKDHEIYIVRKTRREVRNAWRRLAGGAK